MARTSASSGRQGTPSRRKEQVQSSRAALVDAAIRVFDDHDFEEATISQITDLAGLSHGSFYTYFTSKEDVLRSAANELHHRQLERRIPEQIGRAHV